MSCSGHDPVGDLYHPIWPDSGPLVKPKKKSKKKKAKKPSSKSTKVRGSEVKHRLGLLARPPKHVNPKLKKLLKRDGDLCCWCSHLVATPRKIYLWEKHQDERRLTHRIATIEHIKPKCDGGTNRLSNLKVACLSCNSRRLEDPTWEPNPTQ